MDQQDLFIELQYLRRSLVKYFSILPPRSEDWRPRENMRSVWELANHLAQIPVIDTLITREATEQEVMAMEAALKADTAERLLAVWDQGIKAAMELFGTMSAQQFETSQHTSFHGFTMPAKAWLVEIVTHTFHHRAMLHTYLKLMGAPVDMSYVYA